MLEKKDLLGNHGQEKKKLTELPWLQKSLALEITTVIINTDFYFIKGQETHFRPELFNVK